MSAEENTYKEVSGYNSNQYLYHGFIKAINAFVMTQKVDVRFEPSYILHPGSKEKFYPSQVKEITQTFLTNEIEGRIDEKWIEDWQNFPDDFEILSKEISASIKMEVLKN